MTKENEQSKRPEHPHGEPPKGKPEGPPSPPGLGKERPSKVDDEKFA